MKWYLNMKIGNKLMLGFILVSLISGGMGFYTIYNLQVLNRADTGLYEDMTVPLSEIGEISTEFQKTRVNARDLIIAQAPEDIQTYMKSINDRCNNIDKLSEEFEASITSDKMQQIYRDYKAAKNDFENAINKVITLAKNNHDTEAMIMMSKNGESGIAAKDCEEAIDKLVAMQISGAKDAADFNTQHFKKTIMVMTMIIIFTLMLSVCIGFFISKLITRPLKMAVNMIDEMSKGHVRNRLNMESKDEIGQMARSMDYFADELQKKVIAVMNGISEGNVSMDITIKDENDEIAPAIKKTIETIQGLNLELQRLIYAAQEGKLDVRADQTGFTGGWAELIGGVNKLVETVVQPINEVTSVMHEISKGNLNVSVQGDYQGEFGVLSDAVNSTARGLNRVVGEISGVIEQISKGYLDLEPVRQFSGDFVSISNSLNTILESLNMVLGEINTASDQLFIGSKQVSDGSQALSLGATEQASALEELTSSITEVASKTKENAGNANEANGVTLTVQENAEQGNQHMKEMLGAMEEINESSNDIYKIIKVIDDIAFQTNILALNAAVEAARAGQHGKGFAVVAEEVRNLAARSADAAKETAELIQGSMKKSQRGTEIANNTARALDEIVKGVRKTADLISEIATSSNEQAMGISQINLGLTQVSQVVQNNASTAEESAASSEELTGQANMLKDMVGKFKLRYVNKQEYLEAPKIILAASESDKY